MPSKDFINVRLKRTTYSRLESYGRKGETWDDVIARLIRDIERVNFELLTVDGEPATQHTATYIVGNAKYTFNHGKYFLVNVP